jgi:hypothetical protein
MNNININISTSSTNGNMLNGRCRGLQELNSTILACNMSFLLLRYEMVTLQTSKSLALAIKFSFSFLRLARESFDLSILASKLALSFLRLEIESLHLHIFESTLEIKLAFSFLRLVITSWQVLSSLDSFSDFST